MTTISTISTETIEQFIQRHRNGVFTNDVSVRFGMYLPDARRYLKKLERAGMVVSERDSAGANGNFCGAGLVWRWRSRT
jgi:Mn-dependent DtxR family transcriptional regulator